MPRPPQPRSRCSASGEQPPSGFGCYGCDEPMKILVDLSALRRTHWREHLIRFLLGGLVTVITGVIAKVFGPEVGGLFLAFPAIFPASATLLDKHEREKKQKAGIP